MNIIYLGYNLVKTDYKKFNAYLNECSTTYSKSKVSIVLDVLKSFTKYDTRFIDYFYLRFFEPSKINKEEHVSSWDLHKFHKKYNNSNSIILRDKIRFHKYFKEFTNYSFFELEKDNIASLKKWIIERKMTFVVCKNPLGTVGTGVEIFPVQIKNTVVLINGVNFETKVNQLLSEGFILFEEYIIQHSVINKITPNSVNTVRVVTFLNKNNEVDVWGAILRMGYDKKVDNFDAGGISAMIDVNTGTIVSPGIIKHPFNHKEFFLHPVTNEKITGVVIPFWEEAINLVISAAKHLQGVRTVGWDVAITEKGPVIIEGNDNWDKTHFELSTKQGLRSVIRKGLENDI